MPEGLGRGASFRDVLTAAMQEFARRGYSSEADLAEWLMRMQASLDRAMPSDAEVEVMIRDALGSKFARFIDGPAITRMVPGVSRYTIDRVRPELRAELDRRIMASVRLIKLNRKAAVEKTLQRFSGWATAIPAGGDTEVGIREAKARIAKEPAQVRFEARRVAIDQGHKLIANVADVVARGNGAIAMEWRSNWRQAGYDYRPDHKARDGHVYALRGSWAIEDGLMNKGAGYLDDMTMPAQEPYCRCTGRYISTLRSLPDSMLTKKGQDMLSGRGQEPRPFPQAA